MPEDIARFLREATCAGESLRIVLQGQGDAAPIHHEFKYPYVVIGRGEGCDIPLHDANVSFRHAYLQVIEGRLFCVDLASRNGVHWPDGPRKYGWVLPGVPIRIGGYSLQVVDAEAGNGSAPEAPADLNPLERYRGQAGPMPKVDLEFRYETGGEPTCAVDRLLTLIGRGAICKLRMDSPMVSAVHCSLLLTRRGLWAIDLMGRGGTKVDGQCVRAVRLESGSEVAIGSFQIGVFYDEAADVSLGDRLTDNAADSETSFNDLESPYLQDEPIPATASPKPSATPRKPAGFSWWGTIFHADAEEDTFIVIPMIDGMGFRYQQFHLEVSSLQRKFESEHFVNLVVDLSRLNYFGSELIGALIKLARTAGNADGRVAFCSPSPRMREVLDGMRISKLWPILASREEALAEVRKES